MTASPIDPRAWLAWAAAMSLTPMLGRNPFPLVAALIVALAVRSATQHSDDAGWGRLLKLALVFATIGVIFNLLTYHGGDRVIGSIPDWIPVFGGPVTLNAFLFGLLSGLALITLVIVWSTVAARLEWNDLIRLTPPGLSGLAVASSIAVTLVPKTIEAFTEVREVQAIRGFRLRGLRDLVPLVAPMLTLGLERSVTLSEALESRGFGGPESEADRSNFGSMLIGFTLTALAVAAFLVLTGREGLGLIALALAVVAAWLAMRRVRDSRAWRPTVYRPVRMRRSDWLIVIASASSALALLVVNRIDRSALFYEPYPTIGWPAVSLPAILAIALLLAPLLTPVEPEAV